MNESFWQFAVDMWRSGGYLVVPLFFLAAFIFATCAELLLYLRREKLPPVSRETIANYVRAPGTAPGNYGRILSYVTSGAKDERTLQARFDEVSMSLLTVVDRRTRFLDALVVSAPLLGLLGTVVGMLVTFEGLGRAGGSTVDTVADGISQALITTQTGLMIALPGLFVILIVRRRKHQLEASLSRLRSLCLAQLTSTSSYASP